MKPFKIYAENVEETALEQFHSAMEQDFVVRGALMPDAHTGYSLPIGAVVATDRVVVPSWIGYDIGCGMCALLTDFDPVEIKLKAKDIYDSIYETIPVGFQVHEDLPMGQDYPDLTDLGIEAFNRRKGYRHLGTLGGGNHFIEIGNDENGHAWIVIHSGSRGVGHGIATEYMRLASGDGKVREGHFGFSTATQEGRDYLQDMGWALKFALMNRASLSTAVMDILVKHCSGTNNIKEMINANHNHAEMRDGMVIHRKGATQASFGQAGVIPGNMRDGTFIVEGKGCEEALWSSSHGAGRVMGRKQAKRELSDEDFVKTMDGITAKVEHDTLDESPMAYKNIHEVMALQSDLVEVKHHITPIINIKG